MKISRHLHRKLRLKNLLLSWSVIVLIGILAALTNNFQASFDITANLRNTLSAKSREALSAMNGPVVIKAYYGKDLALRAQISKLIELYRQYKPDLKLVFIDPKTQPDKVREMDIPLTGAFFVEYHDRNQRIDFLDESSLTNALLQLSKRKMHWLSFLTGHEERSPSGRANFDLGTFAEFLLQQNIQSQQLNLAEIPAIPENTSILLIASPKIDLLSGELALIKDYISRGGSLMWLTDPDSVRLKTLEELLGIERLPGTVVDDTAKLYGVNDPGFVLVGKYGPHPINLKYKSLTLLPLVSAFKQSDQDSNFNHEILFESSVNSWNETSNISSDSQFDPDSDEIEGPLPLAFALTRKLDDATQRIVVVGDADFLSNAYVNSVGNRDLGSRMVNWLIHEDSFIKIPSKKALDNDLILSETAIALIGFGFLLGLPATLFLTGMIIWHRRKNR